MKRARYRFYTVGEIRNEKGELLGVQEGSLRSRRKVIDRKELVKAVEKLFREENSLDDDFILNVIITSLTRTI